MTISIIKCIVYSVCMRVCCKHRSSNLSWHTHTLTHSVWNDFRHPSTLPPTQFLLASKLCFFLMKGLWDSQLSLQNNECQLKYSVQIVLSPVGQIFLIQVGSKTQFIALLNIQSCFIHVWKRRVVCWVRGVVLLKYFCSSSNTFVRPVTLLLVCIKQPTTKSQSPFTVLEVRVNNFHS